ncbi:hypothetical protein LIP_1746 [Limnochorda pilosa]|uniref:Aluminum resistance protein n=1 Tax=Limnochorda pilosa TaxID=1555112 RepID=A0A0K2SKP0_LIMPI|nr:hypothetical protein LIP_1746 [Limnochorda pilosa]
MLDALHAAGVTEADLAGSTGYGYGDPGREKLEAAYAALFSTEAAVVRPQLASGTHALAALLFGLLRPGDRLLLAAGLPYETLQRVIWGPAAGCLAEWGVEARVVPPGPRGVVDADAVLREAGPTARLLLVQRSRGYEGGSSHGVGELGRLAERLKAEAPQLLLAVDNCYGEFVEEVEPTQVGFDLAAGSLIKNPGGGLAPSGGYVVGPAAAVEQVAARVTAPGIGLEVGPTLGLLRPYFQGLFLAPHVVAEALQGAVLVAAVMEALGFPVAPRWDEPRHELVQEVTLGDPAAVLAFCRGIQAASPVDAMARPEAAHLPGYRDPVVMAAGTFVQGSSIELSADAPMRPPYAVYVQGGLSLGHVALGLERALFELTLGGMLPAERWRAVSDRLGRPAHVGTTERH